MTRKTTPQPTVSKTVSKLIQQIHAEATAATLEALSAKDGIVVLHSPEKPAWTFSRNGSLLMAAENGAETRCHIYHEVTARGPLPHWLVGEYRTDGSGHSWGRSLGVHIVDDFGTLVPVEGGAA